MHISCVLAENCMPHRQTLENEIRLKSNLSSFDTQLILHSIPSQNECMPNRFFIFQHTSKCYPSSLTTRLCGIQNYGRASSLFFGLEIDASEMNLIIYSAINCLYSFVSMTALDGAPDFNVLSKRFY